ncbi:hypothetical protein [Leptothermofonsia sp. ETS-13]|uniref:hypothetical protein n=1 Tax=Leptothermofonsia sp. ETS-13 TaxID=3035696 RepID=UPI003BA35AF4
MRGEIALLTLGVCLGSIGLSDYGGGQANPSSTARTVMGVIAQRPAPAQPNYNCRTRETWNSQKQAWCQKVEKLKKN